MLNWDVHERSALEILARWSLAVVSLVLMASMGGGFVLLPVLIPGHLWAARRSSGMGRVGWSLLPAASLSMLAWAGVYVAVGEAAPVIWLVPALVLVGGLAAVHRFATATGPEPA